VIAQANGENRRYLALAFGAAAVAAVGTKLGEWAVERLRRTIGDPPRPTHSSRGAPERPPAHPPEPPTDGGF